MLGLGVSFIREVPLALIAGGGGNGSGRILQEDDGLILLEDGTSAILMEQD
jgi:hypothetical protein